MPPRSLPSVFETFKEYLSDSAGDRQGIVLLAPGRLVDGSGMNLMVLAEGKREAHAQLQTAAAALASPP